MSEMILGLIAGKSTLLIGQQQWPAITTLCIEFFNEAIVIMLCSCILIPVASEHKKWLKFDIDLAVLYFSSLLGHILLCIDIGRDNHLIIVAHILIGAFTHSVIFG